MNPEKPKKGYVTPDEVQKLDKEGVDFAVDSKGNVINTSPVAHDPKLRKLTRDQQHWAAKGKEEKNGTP